jgi:hypothetical protein
MKRKTLSLSGLFLLIVMLSVPFYTFADNKKEPHVKNGIYSGKFNGNSMFYESDSGRIKKIGPSFPVKELIGVNSESFLSYVSENYFDQYIYCTILPITRLDFSKAVIGSNKEFVGLHCGPMIGDPDYQEGILLAIKSLPNENFQITLLDLGTGKTFRTVGEVSTIKKPILHRKLSFFVNGEINNFGNELWELTLNPITNYVWRGIFNIYINGVWRFEVEVIDN